MQHIKIRLFIFAILTLLIGFSIYIFERPVLSSIYNSTGLDYTFNGDFVKFPTFFNSLPSFAHTFSFIVFSFLVIKLSKIEFKYLCIFWLFIELLLEVPQIINEYPEDYSFEYTTVINSIYSYFVNGVFDWLDILSIMLGTFLAYKLINSNYYESKKNY